MKKCRDCGEGKPLSAFSRRKVSKDGYFNSCKVCRSQWARKYRKENREHCLEVRQTHYSRNQEKIAKQQKAWRNRNRFVMALQRSRCWATADGYRPCTATAEEIEAVFDGYCAICRVAETLNAPLCLDHDHETGKFRGWLCRACNTTLGRLGDNLQGVERFLAYFR